MIGAPGCGCQAARLLRCAAALAGPHAAAQLSRLLTGWPLPRLPSPPCTLPRAPVIDNHRRAAAGGCRLHASAAPARLRPAAPLHLAAGSTQHGARATPPPSSLSLPCPVFRRWFGIPSYYVQQMFAQTAGTHYLSTAVVHSPSSEASAGCVWAERAARWHAERQQQPLPRWWLCRHACWLGRADWRAQLIEPPARPPAHETRDGAQVHEDKVAASATCGTPACDRLHAKIVNFSSYRQRVAGERASLGASLGSA